MFIKTSDPYFALQLESIISLQATAGGGGSYILTARLVDGSTTTVDAFGTLVEARAAFDALIEHLGWIPI